MAARGLVNGRGPRSGRDSVFRQSPAEYLRMRRGLQHLRKRRMSVNDGLELVNVGSRVHQCGNLLDNVGGMRTEHMTAEYSARILRTFGGNHNLAESLRLAH